MWLEILSRAGNACAVNEPLAAYRISGNSLSANKIKSIYWTWKIYRVHLGLSVWHGVVLMFSYIFKAFFKRF